MKNEKAKTTLLNAAWLGSDRDREEIEEAVSVAIDAMNRMEKLTSCDAIDRQAAKEAVKRASASGTVQMSLMKILDGMPSVNPQPCEDAISRQASIDELKKYFSDDGMKDTEYGAYWHHVHVIDVLKSMPSVQPIRPRGHWIEEDGYDGDTYYDCSVCGESWTTIEGTPWDNGMKYCPNCGADMRESEESDADSD